jgi:protein-S-isoprenylcysteine O-methyltransferase Ste14
MNVDSKLLVVEIAIMFVVFALALCLAAGTVAWPAGWAFLTLFFSFVVLLSLWLLRHNPDLLKERMTNFKRDQKAWDKVFFVAANIVCMTWLILMPLDAVRFRWSHMPAWLQGIGAVVLLCSFCLFYLTFRENSYLSPMVRIQTDRGQAVVSTGPYHYVRHPMYSGAILWTVGTALLLGSWYGLLFGLVLLDGLVAVRAVLEENTLRAELPGYAAYMTEVKYRLIPHVW